MDNNTNGQPSQAVKDKIALYDFVSELLPLRPELNLTAEEKPLVIEQLVKELDYTINAHLMDLLSDQAVEEFNTLLDSNPTDEQVDAFLANHIPNLSTEIAAAMLEFKTIFLYNPEADGGAQASGTAPAPAMDQTGMDQPMSGESSPAIAENTPSEETPPAAPPTEM